ncbi:MAG: DedA family protein [Candidatus Tokpelaia sp.]|nr:MAG: DedA family protein [Candidatus Tokpelaia sp.]KAA6206719.1 MAG: DedA family protein [Candidatus Tokpelaia sp.]
MTIVQHITYWIAHYGGLSFFPLMYVNALGLPLVPAGSLLFAGSVLADKGKIDFNTMLLAAFAGTFLGGQTAWYIGHWGGQKLVARLAHFLYLDRQKFAGFAAMTATKGVYFVVIARFIPLAREFNGLICGSLGMSFGRYLTGNFIGALLWVLCWGALPDIFGHIL